MHLCVSVYADVYQTSYKGHAIGSYLKATLFNSRQLKTGTI
jgi:hypothetical protein